MNLHQLADSPLCDEGLGTEYDIVEQNFDPTHLANYDNKQLPILIHKQNNNNDLNDQIYDCDNLQDEPYSPMRAKFQTNDNSQSDSQSIKINTPTQTVKARIHAPPMNSYLDIENFHQNIDTEFQDDSFVSHDREISLLKHDTLQSQDFRTHDDQQIVMVNDENEFLQQLLSTPSDIQPTHFFPNAQIPNRNTQNDGRAIYNITLSDIPPDI